MIIITFIIIFSLLFIIFLFSSPRLSPIPYFPTNPHDLKLIIQALDLKDGQSVIDLGAGTGTVIFAAASYALISSPYPPTTKFIAVEMNPLLIFVLHLKRFFHPNRKNIKIVWGDMFKIGFKSQKSKFKNTTQNSKVKEQPIINHQHYNNITIYLYVSPWLLEKIVSKIKKEIGSCNIVSYYYPVISLKRQEKIYRGKNNIYSYRII